MAEHTLPPECSCDGRAPYCCVCLVDMALAMRRLHPGTLSISMLRRRIQSLTHREAAILVEATKWLPAKYEVMPPLREVKRFRRA